MVSHLVTHTDAEETYDIYLFEDQTKSMNLSTALTASHDLVSPKSSAERIKLPQSPESLLIRPDVETKLQAELSENSGIHSNYLMLVGPRGSGKSTLIHRIVRDIKNRDLSEVPFEYVLFARIPQLVDKDDSGQIIERLVEEISYQLGFDRDARSYLAQIRLIQTEFRKRTALLIIDGLREKFVDIVVEFLNGLNVSGKVLIVGDKKLDIPNSRSIEIDHLTEDEITDFIEKYNPKLEAFQDKNQLSNYVSLIGELTGGILRELIGLLSFLESFSNRIREQNKPAQVAQWQIEQLESLRIESKRRPTSILTLEFESFKIAEQTILKYLTLFEHPVQAQILSSLSRIAIDETSEALHKLSQDGWLNVFQQKTQIYTLKQYLLNDSSRDFVHSMFDEEELGNFKQQWINFFRNLRSNDSKYPLEWTTMTTYMSEPHCKFDYSDEIDNIIDVIRYCLESKHVSRLWNDAAKMTYDFRAVLFSTGRWDTRNEFSEDLIKHAVRANNIALEGRFYRLTAWVYCFRDEFEKSIAAVDRSLQIASPFVTSVTNLATEHIVTLTKELAPYFVLFYQAINTRGQIALREARHKLVAKTVALRNQDKERAEKYHIKAKKKFNDAERYFKDAKKFVKEYHPKEEMIVEFYLAEVEYYRRHIIADFANGLEKLWIHLDNVKQQFEFVLSKASDADHDRLIAHSQYYLGKINRRLALLTEHDESENFFHQAMERFEEAEQIASRYNDSVLWARILFAKGQLYESKAVLASSTREKQKYLFIAEKLIIPALQSLTQFGMMLEVEDGIGFLKNRITEKKGESLTRFFQDKVLDRTNEIVINVDFPEICEVKQNCTLKIGLNYLIFENSSDINSNASSLDTHPISIFIIPCASNFEVETQWAEISVSQRQPSAQLELQLKPMRKGKQFIEVEILRSTSRIGYYVFHVNVTG